MTLADSMMASTLSTESAPDSGSPHTVRHSSSDSRAAAAHNPALLRLALPPDREIPDLTNELLCLKDADGLDRVRLGDLNAAYLRSDHARSWQDAAQQLYEAAHGEGTDDPWRDVREAALALNLWR